MSLQYILSRWYFTDSDCSDPGERWRTLSLHTAILPGQFCCDSGHCLPSEMRCDSSRDCPDLSDEENCSLLERKNDTGGDGHQVNQLGIGSDKVVF